MPQNDIHTSTGSKIRIESFAISCVNDALENMKNCGVPDLEKHRKLINKKYEKLKKSLEESKSIEAMFSCYDKFEEWLQPYVECLLNEEAEGYGGVVKKYLLLNGRTPGSNKKEALDLCRQLSIPHNLADVCADEMEVARCKLLDAIKAKRGGKNVVKSIDVNKSKMGECAAQKFKSSMMSMLVAKDLYK